MGGLPLQLLANRSRPQDMKHGANADVLIAFLSQTLHTDIRGMPQKGSNIMHVLQEDRRAHFCAHGGGKPGVPSVFLQVSCVMG